LETLLGGILLLSAVPLASCGNAAKDTVLCPTDRILNAYVLSPTVNADGGSTGLSYYIDSTTNTAVVAQGSLHRG
jgi:hypothetical protein